MYFKRIVCDVDDTISITKNRDWGNAVPVQAVIDKINYLYSIGWEIWLETARGSISCATREEADTKYREQIQAWLLKHGVQYHKLSFEKSLATYYIDDKSLTPEQFINLDIKVLSGGWSGANIELRDGKVYKTQKDSLSVAKWYDLASNFFDVPQIYTLIGETICMEYIKVDSKVRIKDVFDLCMQFKEIIIPNNCSFSTYIQRIKNHCFFADDFYWAIEYLEGISKICESQSSFCHGDLTSENILSRGGKLFLIDPIYDENCYSSFLLDLSKFSYSLRRDNRMVEYANFFKMMSVNKLPLNVIRILELSQWIRVYKYAPEDMKKKIKDQIECFKD